MKSFLSKTETVSGLSRCYAQKNSNNTRNVFKKTGTFILFSLLIFVIGCSKEKQMIIDNKWQVESIKVHADSAIQYPSLDKKYTLTFHDKKSFHLSLDVNSSFGKVKFSSNNKISFKDGAQTYKCCDSKFAEDMLVVLIKTETYDMNDSILVLMGENGEIINLKKQ